MVHPSEQDCNFPQLGDGQSWISARRRKTPLSLQGGTVSCQLRMIASCASAKGTFLCHTSVTPTAAS